MQIKICVMTGTRAEYGLLRNLLLKLNNNDSFDLQLVVTGTHLSKKFGNTQLEILKDGLTFEKVKIPLNNDTKYGMAISTGKSIKQFSKILCKLCPNLVMVLGDRYEAFAFASASYILGIPIAHISGGDITEGLLDEGFRHCITKLSTFHFPSCEDSRKRIIQMGEQPENVVSVGDPGVENCLHTELFSLEKLMQNLNFSLEEKKYGVVTFHPVTQECKTAEAQLKNLISVMEKHECFNYIITTANADAGGREINKIWYEQSKFHKNWLVVPSLGFKRYLSAVKHSLFVLGNSSSGIIEAPVLGVPTINIGDRQKGRTAAASVITCGTEVEQINEAIKKAISTDFQNIASKCISPYNEGDTSSEIIDFLKKKFETTVSLKKVFYNIGQDK